MASQMDRSEIVEKTDALRVHIQMGVKFNGYLG